MNRFCFFLLFLLIPFSGAWGYKYELSVTAIFRDEARFLKEWIEFHRLVGVEHFFLFNNLSQDHYKEVLKPYQDLGIVELFEWPYETSNLTEWDQTQIGCYEFALKYARRKTQWLAILDTDEFLYPVEGSDLKQFLKAYEGFGGLLVNWVMFGTSEVSKVGEGSLMIEQLTRCSKNGNDHFKSIFQTRFVDHVASPHYVFYKPGYFHVTPSANHMVAPFIEIDRIRINHYFSRDEEFLHQQKIPRRLKIGTPADACLEWNKHNNQEQDDTIERFVKPLRKAMGL